MMEPLGGMAALALAKIGDRGSVAPLMKALKGSFWEGRDEDVAAYSALAMAKMRVPEAVVPTIELLKTDDEDVLYLACMALGEQGDPRARPALEELRDDRLEVLFYDMEKGDFINTTVGESARAALARIGGAIGPS
jgi:HEAT repeat protein